MAKTTTLVHGAAGANIKLALGKTKELGGYAQYAVALESQLWTSPKGMSFNEAASLPKVALTSYKALVWYAGVLLTTALFLAQTLLQQCCGS